MVRYPDVIKNIKTPDLKMGYHDDSFTQESLRGSSWFFLLRMIRVNATNQWKLYPIRGETTIVLDQSWKLNKQIFIKVQYMIKTKFVILINFIINYKSSTIGDVCIAKTIKSSRFIQQYKSYQTCLHKMKIFWFKIDDVLQQNYPNSQNFRLYIKLQFMIKIIASANSHYFKTKYNFFSVKNLLKRMLSAYERTINPKQQPTVDLTKYQQFKIPKTLQQKEDSIAQFQANYGMIEAQRLKQLDKVLNTSTYFQHTRYYQKRLDSQNILSIKRMKNKYQSQLRNIIKGLQDPQKPVQQKIRNRKIHNLNLAKLRQYPIHPININIQNTDQAQTTKFLTKQILFTRLSFKQIENMKITFLQQEIQLPPQLILTSKYVYFKKQHQPSVYRIVKEKFYKYQNKQQLSIVEIDQVLTIKQIYDALKIYDQDPRVQKYLEKYQNSNLEAIVDKMIWSHTQRYICGLINLTLQQQQYCLIVKDTLTGNVYKQIFFNISKDAIIYNNNLIYIKMDDFGNYNQVYQFNLQTKQNNLIFSEKQQNNLRLEIDPSFEVYYLYRTRLQDHVDEQVLVYGFQKSEFITLLDYQKFKYKVFLSPKGFIYTKYQQPKNEQQIHINIDALAEQIYLIPFQQQNSLMKVEEERRVQKLQSLQELINQVNSINIGRNIKTPEIKKKNKISNNHSLLYICDENQFIKDIIVNQTHLIAVLFNKWTSSELYSKIKFFPFKQNSPNTQLLLKNQIINLYPYQDYRDQTIRFQTQNIFNTHYIYNIWKKQLSQAYPNEFHQETFQFKTRDQYEISTTIYCQKKYIGKVLPCIIFVPTTDQDMIDVEIMMALLKKGILVCVFKGRGSLYGNYELFKNGTGKNIFMSAQDIVDTAIYLIQEKLSDNISLYGKGMIGGIVGLYANILYPQIFTATSLYNGVYDINNPILTSHELTKKLFGDFQKEEIKQFWKKNSPHELQIRTNTKTNHNMFYDQLSNILLSQNIHSTFESRKLIYKLRSSKRKYPQIYYQQFTNQKEADLQNCCYLFKNMLNSYSKESF